MRGLTRRVPSNKDGGVPRRCRARRDALPAPDPLLCCLSPYRALSKPNLRRTTSGFPKSRNSQSRRGSLCVGSCVRAGVWLRCHGWTYLRRASLDRRTPRTATSVFKRAACSSRASKPSALPLPLHRTRPSPATRQIREILVQPAGVRLIGRWRNQRAALLHKLPAALTACARQPFAVAVARQQNLIRVERFQDGSELPIAVDKLSFTRLSMIEADRVDGDGTPSCTGS